MRRSFPPLLVPLIAAASLLAGCGSTSSSGSTTALTSAPVVPATGAAASQTAALCKHIVTQAVLNNAAAKSKTEALCEKLANGDAAGVKQAAGEICDAVLKASPLPEGSAKQQALAACRSGLEQAGG